MIHLSELNVKRLGSDEGNILTAFLETQPPAARNRVLVYIPSNAIYFERQYTRLISGNVPACSSLFLSSVLGVHSDQSVDQPRVA